MFHARIEASEEAQGIDVLCVECSTKCVYSVEREV